MANFFSSLWNRSHRGTIKSGELRNDDPNMIGQTTEKHPLRDVVTYDCGACASAEDIQRRAKLFAQAICELDGDDGEEKRTQRTRLITLGHLVKNMRWNAYNLNRAILAWANQVSINEMCLLENGLLPEEEVIPLINQIAKSLKVEPDKLLGKLTDEPLHDVQHEEDLLMQYE